MSADSGGMRIQPTWNPVLAAQVGASPTPRDGARFRLGERDRPGSADAARAAAPLATLDAILALQGEEDPAERRRRSARRGQDLLDALDDLKATLLAGAAGSADLRRLAARLATGAATSGDPTLDALVASIELRAKVELAKRGLWA